MPANLQKLEERHGTTSFLDLKKDLILFVTESKLILLAIPQANKSRDELFGQGIVTLFGKPADQEDGGLVSQRTILPELACRLLLY